MSDASSVLPALEELAHLLDEDPAAAAIRASGRLELTGKAIVLYGAGTLGQIILERLRQSGVEVAAFADDTPQKQGTSVDGVPILTVRDAARRFDRVLFVVTILNARLSFLEARARLKAVTAAPVASFLDLAWMFPERFLPYYQFERPESVLQKRDAILHGARILHDEESRRQFAGHMRFRLHLDYDALPRNSLDLYFPADVLPPLADDCVFVDCGAFDGDSVRRFLEHQHGRFGEIHAFEPDPQNCEKLESYVRSLPSDAGRRIHVHRAAVSDRNGTLRFNKAGNMSSSISAGGTTEVDALRVDDVVQANGRQVYAKYDVEGAECDALRGTSALLAGTRTLLAVSIYHRPDDLWELPLYLHSLGLGRRLYLRTQGEDGMDVVCYAV